MSVYVHVFLCACVRVCMNAKLILIYRLLGMQHDVTTKEGRVKGLGVFLQCNPDSAKMQ